MPVFIGEHRNVIWSIRIAREFEMLPPVWEDFTPTENAVLEQAWGNEEDFVYLEGVEHSQFRYYMPMHQGGPEWCRGMSPFRMNVVTHEMTWIRRTLWMA